MMNKIDEFLNAVEDTRPVLDFSDSVGTCYIGADHKLHMPVVELDTDFLPDLRDWLIDILKEQDDE